MKNIGKDIIYATKIWLLSVIASPFLLVIGLFIVDGFKMNSDAFGFILLAIVAGGLYSIPCWLTFMVAIRTVYRVGYSEERFKIIVNIIAVVIAFAIFALVFFSLVGEGLLWAFPYIMVLTFGIWFFKLEPKEKVVPTTIDHLIE